MTIPVVVYSLCLLMSAFCAFLLIRTYRQTRTALLLWSAICFVCLAVNNLLLVLDAIVFPELDLSTVRQMANLVGLTALLYGMIWETK
jgi:hypothetical protein